MNSNNYNLNKRRIEFIKSGALLLLAIVLLVSAVVAWFGNFTNTTVVTLSLSVTNAMDEIVLDEEVVTDNVVILPAATKFNDSTVSATDLSKVIKVIPLVVKSPTAKNVEIYVKPADGLYCYIDTKYDPGTDDALSYANEIKSNFAVAESYTTPFTYEEGEFDEAEQVNKRTVAIVYFADYDIHHQTIRDNGEVLLNSLLRFTPAD